MNAAPPGAPPQPASRPRRARPQGEVGSEQEMSVNRLAFALVFSIYLPTIGRDIAGAALVNLAIWSIAAVAIFAHYSILLKNHDSHWWLQGWGDHLMSRALEVLDDEHREWLDWPIKEMGWTGR